MSILILTLYPPPQHTQPIPQSRATPTSRRSATPTPPRAAGHSCPCLYNSPSAGVWAADHHEDLRTAAPGAPDGARGCSHGWSDAALSVAEPVETRHYFFLFSLLAAPEGRREPQSNTYRSSNSISCSLSIRSNSDLKSSFLWCSACVAM